MTNSVFLLAARENWVCDRFVREWYDNNPDISTTDINDASVIWLVAGWCWSQISKEILRKKKVILTVHHIVLEKFNDKKLHEFKERDLFVDRYHVPCEKTRDQIAHLTEKPIDVIPFWSNQKIWYPIKSKSKLRKKYGIEESSYVVGSFQRDTEGSDLISPKLEKGPDLFCDFIEKISKDRDNICVLLAGWRRQYVMSRLRNKNIPFYYCELPTFEILNELYNCLDLYVVAARCEGGPQAIAECSLTKTPIVSTDVGLAKKFLHEKSIFDNKWNASPDIEYSYSKIQDFIIPKGFDRFRDIIGKM
jgi:glycosyltransferase involved in cell wall biosynthesis